MEIISSVHSSTWSSIHPPQLNVGMSCLILIQRLNKFFSRRYPSAIPPPSLFSSPPFCVVLFPPPSLLHCSFFKSLIFKPTFGLQESLFPSSLSSFLSSLSFIFLLLLSVFFIPAAICLSFFLLCPLSLFHFTLSNPSFLDPFPPIQLMKVR